MALYVYGVMRASDAARATGRLSEDAGQLVAVEHDGLAALASETPDQELRLRRENIMAHADVLQSAFDCGTVLPLRFGSVLPSRDVVAAQLLAPRSGALKQRLSRLDGKCEMQVKATYAEEPLLRSILAHDRRLAGLVQRTRQLPAAATHFERIRIGEAIAGAVQGRRSHDEQQLLAALRPLAVAVTVSQPHHERAVLNAAFLVEKSALTGFDQSVQSMSERFGGDAEFKLIGPMPPYSFADQDWERTEAGQLEATWA